MNAAIRCFILVKERVITKGRKTQSTEITFPESQQALPMYQCLTEKYRADLINPGLRAQYFGATKKVVLNA